MRSLRKSRVLTRTAYRAMARRLARMLPASSAWLFAREWVNEPALVGAIWPSSTRLATRMAARVPRHRDGLVIELGAGTGAVTEALLAHGIAPERLVVVE